MTKEEKYLEFFLWVIILSFLLLLSYAVYKSSLIKNESENKIHLECSKVNDKLICKEIKE